jgi:hypothetical protein
MSRSNRDSWGTAQNFPTPKWAVRRLLEKLDISEYGDRWLEPSAGDGTIIDIVNSYRDDIKWLAVDIRDTTFYLQMIGLSRSEIVISDFFDLDFTYRFDVAILNPPFRHGVDFIRRCRDISNYIIAFQSLNFLGSRDRNTWLIDDCPDVYVLPDRASHTGSSSSDTVYSAWYVWGPCRRRYGDIHVLDLTSLIEKKDSNLRIKDITDDRINVIRSMTDVID